MMPAQGRKINERSVNETDAEIGRKVRRRRLELGLSQANLGAALGVSYQQIQKYENGRNRIGASRLRLIATTLDISIDQFFADHAKAEVMSLIDISDAVVLKAVRAFSRIEDKATQRKIVELAEALSGVKNRRTAQR